jgi:chromosome segregation ATPase
MSSANSAAIKRRANQSKQSSPQYNPSPSPQYNPFPSPQYSPVSQQQYQQQQPSTNQPSTNGYTLPQVISIMDKRLNDLESQNRETMENEFEEFDSRFDLLAEEISNLKEKNDMLAEEISNLKQIILGLQTYTMDVNKMLLENRTKT